MAETEELDELVESTQDAHEPSNTQDAQAPPKDLVESARDAEPSKELEERGEGEEEATPAAELDPEVRARRDAALSHVRKLGDPVLRASALDSSGGIEFTHGLGAVAFLLRAARPL